MSGCEEYDYFKVSMFLRTASELHSMCLFQSIYSGVKKGTFGLTHIQIFGDNNTVRKSGDLYARTELFCKHKKHVASC